METTIKEFKGIKAEYLLNRVYMVGFEGIESVGSHNYDHVEREAKNKLRKALESAKEKAKELDEVNAKLLEALQESNKFLNWISENADVPKIYYEHFYNQITNIQEQNKPAISSALGE